MNVNIRPRLNKKRIQQFATLAHEMPIDKPLNFYGVTGNDGKEVIFDDMYPPLNAEGVIDYFFFAMIHNYGFWLDNGTVYTSPYYGVWQGKNNVEGSNLLWKTLRTAWKKDPTCLTPSRLDRISDAEHEAIFSDDRGVLPLFNTKERIALTRDYGRWFRSVRMAGKTPSELLAYANEHYDPIGILRNILTHPENGINGYREDPLGKKAELLIMALVHRPEEFLRKSAGSVFLPIVDYHDMRLTLRLGHIILPTSWITENEERRLVSHAHEEAIRLATYRADELLIRESGRTRDDIDMLKWSALKYCHETTTPNCGACRLQSVCAKKLKLFQPLYRTTFY